MGNGLGHCCVINIFPHVENFGKWQIIDHEKEKPRAQFRPLGHSWRDFTPPWQAVFAKFDPLKPASKEADNSVDSTVRDIKLFQLRY